MATKQTDPIPSERYVCQGCENTFAPVESAPSIEPAAGHPGYVRNGACPACGQENPRMRRVA